MNSLNSISNWCPLEREHVAFPCGMFIYYPSLGQVPCTTVVFNQKRSPVFLSFICFCFWHFFCLIGLCLFALISWFVFEREIEIVFKTHTKSLIPKHASGQSSTQLKKKSPCIGLADWINKYMAVWRKMPWHNKFLQDFYVDVTFHLVQIWQ